MLIKPALVLKRRSPATMQPAVAAMSDDEPSAITVGNDAGNGQINQAALLTRWQFTMVAPVLPSTASRPGCRTHGTGVVSVLVHYWSCLSRHRVKRPQFAVDLFELGSQFRISISDHLRPQPVAALVRGPRADRYGVAQLGEGVD